MKSEAYPICLMAPRIANCLKTATKKSVMKTLNERSILIMQITRSSARKTPTKNYTQQVMLLYVSRVISVMNRLLCFIFIFKNCYLFCERWLRCFVWPTVEVKFFFFSGLQTFGGRPSFNEIRCIVHANCAEKKKQKQKTRAWREEPLDRRTLTSESLSLEKYRYM